MARVQSEPDPDLTEALAEDPTLCVTGLDHDYETTYEDDEVWQGECKACGAEAMTDKNDTN